jgi:hypothetical protein
MGFEIAIGIGLLLLGVVAGFALFYFGMSRPIKDEDQSKARYQYSTERSRRSGVVIKKKK